MLNGLAELGRHLGYGIGLLANLLNPEVVMLGGYYEPLAPWLLPGRRGRAARPGPRPRRRRLPAGGLDAGHDAAATGGAGRLLDAVDSGQLRPARPGRSSTEPSSAVSDCLRRTRIDRPLTGSAAVPVTIADGHSYDAGSGSATRCGHRRKSPSRPASEHASKPCRCARVHALSKRFDAGRPPASAPGVVPPMSVPRPRTLPRADAGRRPARPAHAGRRRSACCTSTRRRCPGSASPPSAPAPRPCTGWPGSARPPSSPRRSGWPAAGTPS